VHAVLPESIPWGFSKACAVTRPREERERRRVEVRREGKCIVALFVLDPGCSSIVVGCDGYKVLCGDILRASGVVYGESLDYCRRGVLKR
jgi:hypothetical protein